MKRMSRDVVLGAGVTLGQLETVQKTAMASGDEPTVQLTFRAGRGEPEALRTISSLIRLGYGGSR